MNKSLIGIIFTILVITLTALSGPVHAINVNLTTPDIDVSTESTKTFVIEVEVNDGEFLPIHDTDLIFNANNQDTVCNIDENNDIDCDFLSVVSREISGLNSNFDYGYGYGYGYLTNLLGWQDFGYGYGYGYGSRGIITGNNGGTITYTLEVNTAKLPSNFINTQVNVQARVYGGSQDDVAYFVGNSDFEVTQSQAGADEATVLATKEALTEKLILNGNKDLDNVIGNLYLPTNLTGLNAAISWSSSNTNVIATSGNVTRAGSNSTVILTATIQKGAYSKSKEFTVVVKQTVAAAVLVGDGEVAVGVETEVVIDNSNKNSLKQITVPTTVADDEEVVVNLVSLVDNDKKLTLGVNALTLSRNSNTGVSYSVEIPSGTTIQGEANWNGLITVPTVKANSEVTVIGGSADLVVEVGSTGVKLTFDKAVKLTLPNRAGKSAGYVGSDNVFNTIPTCTASEIADPNTLPVEGNCYTTSGNDMIIWTKHFTKFVSYAPTSSSSGPSSGSNTNQGLSTTTEEGEEVEGEFIAEVLAEEVPSVPIQAVEQPSQPSGLGGITGAVVGGDRSNVPWIIGIGALVFVIIAGVWQLGSMRKNNKGMYF